MSKMNLKFKAAVQDAIDCFDQSQLAEIFNIYASDYINLEWLRKEELYIFNILDNKQAARAVAKFGFEAVAIASKEDWIIYAEKEEGSKEWKFSSKSPKAVVNEYLEYIIYDMICRPKEYPSWVIDIISAPICNLAAGLFYN